MQLAIRVVMLCLFATTAQFSWAQVTTATLSGSVTDTKGEPLVGVTVRAEHTPSGTFYGTVTRDNGRFTLPNMRVGGPYTVTTTYTGYRSGKNEGILLSLAPKTDA